MLPADLLSQRVHGDAVVPRRLPVNTDTLALAADLIAVVRAAQGHTRGDLDAALQVLEGDQTDYRLKRGLAHLLVHDYSTFEVASPVAPLELRRRVFALSAQTVPSLPRTREIFTAVADALSQEMGRDIDPEQVRAWLYADLPDAQVLTAFEEPTPETLLHRYNLAQAQGVLYRASQVVLTAHRNNPGEYKLLFRYLKLFGLMAYIEGDADHGFTLTIDGPASLFTPSPRYGLALAKLLPALLHVTRWQLTATLVPRQRSPSTTPGPRFTLEAGCGLMSHYPPGHPYDSILEQALAERWAQTPTPWRLEREVDLIPLPGSVMVPDFRLVHPDGRRALLEIVGYWRPAYLRKKFAQVRRAGRSDLVLAISERLNLERAGVHRHDLPGPVVWFTDRVLPKAVLAVLEGEGPRPRDREAGEA